MDKTHFVVADVMTMNPIVIDVRASLEDADHLLRSCFITGLPVVDIDGLLVGVISETDLAAYRFANRTPGSDEAGQPGGRVF